MINEKQLQNGNLVLDKEGIAKKIKRLALEIVEQNPEEQELIIAGVEGNGEVVAAAILAELKSIFSFPVSYLTVKINKKLPSSAYVENAIKAENKVLILVDDVADSGRTLFFALKPFMAACPKKIQTLVLVERSHKLFPVQSDFVGISLATTLMHQISVTSEDGLLTGAWLY